MDDTPKVVDFYCYEGTDPYGRTHADMIALNDFELENSHDVIQWLFPLHEKSAFNDDAPLIDQQSMNILRNNSTSIERMYSAVQRFTKFLGFDVKYDELPATGHSYLPNDNFAERFKVWGIAFNHNHLRITRVIRSVRFFGMSITANAIFSAVYLAGTNNGCASKKTKDYWIKALKDDLFETLR